MSRPDRAGVTVQVNGRGSTSSLPDMRAWESVGHAETADFRWEA
jgi:hypothetical protein